MNFGSWYSFLNCFKVELCLQCEPCNLFSDYWSISNYSIGQEQTCNYLSSTGNKVTFLTTPKFCPHFRQLPFCSTRTALNNGGIRGKKIYVRMELQYIIVFLLKNRRIDSHHLSFTYENKKVFDLFWSLLDQLFKTVRVGIFFKREKTQCRKEEIHRLTALSTAN